MPDKWYQSFLVVDDQFVTLGCRFKAVDDDQAVKKQKDILDLDARGRLVTAFEIQEISPEILNLYNFSNPLDYYNFISFSDEILITKKTH
jgi:hypothetical protein